MGESIEENIIRECQVLWEANEKHHTSTKADQDRMKVTITALKKQLGKPNKYRLLI